MKCYYERTASSDKLADKKMSPGLFEKNGNTTRVIILSHESGLKWRIKSYIVKPDLVNYFITGKRGSEIIFSQSAFLRGEINTVTLRMSD